MEHIEENLKFINQNNKDSLVTIGTKIQQGRVNAKEELKKILDNIKDSTASLQSLMDASTQSLDGLSAE